MHRIREQRIIRLALCVAVNSGITMTTDSAAMELPPIRFWGDVSTGYLALDSEASDSRTVQSLSTLRLNTSTYLWKPWFATLNGSATSSVARNDSDSEERSSSDSSLSGGSATLMMFPQSRFPFTGYIDRTTSEINNDDGLQFGNINPDTRDDFIGTTRYGVAQQYRNQQGDLRLNTRLDHRDRQSRLSDNEKSDSFSVNGSRLWSTQRLQLSSRYDESTNETDDNHSTSVNLTGRHSYNPTPSLSFENLATGASSESRQTSISNPIDFRQRSKQVSSFGVWRPKLDRPLTVTGSVRLSGLDTEEATTEREVETAVLTSGLVYDLTPFVRTTGNVTVNKFKESQRSDLFSSQSGGITYQPDSVLLQEYRYRWSTGADLSNRTGEESGQQLSGQIDHSLDRRFQLDRRGRIRMTLNQGLGSTSDTENPDFQRLIHSLTTGWTMDDERNTTIIRLTASDSRLFGDDEHYFQLLNLQASRNSPLSRSSSWSGNLTFQASRTKADADAVTALLASGQLRYGNTRFMDIPRLRFSTELQISANDFISEDSRSTFDSSNDRLLTEWRTRFSYLIGRLSLQLDTRTINTDGEVDKLVQIRLIRGFGDI